MFIDLSIAFYFYYHYLSFKHCSFVQSSSFWKAFVSKCVNQKAMAIPAHRKTQKSSNPPSTSIDPPSRRPLQQVQISHLYPTDTSAGQHHPGTLYIYRALYDVIYICVSVYMFFLNNVYTRTGCVYLKILSTET